MWDYVGIVRSRDRIRLAQQRLTVLAQEIGRYLEAGNVSGPLIELRNLAVVAELIIASARQRKESRGLHYNIDYPDRDNKLWRRDTIQTAETIEAPMVTSSAP